MRNFLLRSALSAFVLGGVGYLCGYYGPLALNPDANLGPLLGVFITGPVGFGLGIALGLTTSALQLSPAKFFAILATSAVLTAAVALFLSLPEDRYQGFVIDAEIRGCKAPSLFANAAVTRWDRWNVETTWRTPRVGWKTDIPRMLERDRGVVVSLIVHRRWEIYEQRKPWNAGRLLATRSKEGTVENYFSRDSRDCSQVRRGNRTLYSPDWEPSSISPPDVLPTFLGFYVLKPVSPRFKTLLGEPAG